MKKIPLKEAQILRQSVNFEVSLSQKARQSEKRAWIVASISVLIIIALVAGYIVIMPLKEKIPYLVMADPYTGTASLTKIKDSYGVEEITRNEAINKSNISHFIHARESYDWDLIGRRDWNTVHAMGVASVNAAYAEIFSDTNPASPDKIYGRDKSVRVRIKTIVLLSPNSNGKFNGATVRFDKIIINKRDNRPDNAESFIATIAFEYNDNLKMAEEFRYENPLGFRVLSYRVDPEIGSQKAAILREISAEAAGMTPDRTR